MREPDFLKYLLVRAREPASFWRENAIAVVTLLRGLARMRWWRQVIKCWKFSHFARKRAKPPSRKITVLTFLVKKE